MCMHRVFANVNSVIHQFWFIHYVDKNIGPHLLNLEFRFNIELNTYYCSLPLKDCYEGFWAILKKSLKPNENENYKC